MVIGAVDARSRGYGVDFALVQFDICRWCGKGNGSENPYCGPTHRKEAGSHRKKTAALFAEWGSRIACHDPDRPGFKTRGDALNSAFEDETTRFCICASWHIMSVEEGLRWDRSLSHLKKPPLSVLRHRFFVGDVCTWCGTNLTRQRKKFYCNNQCRSRWRYWLNDHPETGQCRSPGKDVFEARGLAIAAIHTDRTLTFSPCTGTRHFHIFTKSRYQHERQQKNETMKTTTLQDVK